MEELQIEIVAGSRPDVRILRLTGPFTLATMFDFQNIVREGAAAVTIIDLSSVPYMDSAALGALTGVSGRIRTLFQVAGVDGFLMCYDTPEQAEAQLATGA